MRAAIYARKSTDQGGVADEVRSVTRQVESARAYATAKGWTVLGDQVYVDDGISGAEFANRPGFVRLMAAAGRKPRPFDVLIMSEESRLGREQIETAYALKQLITAGVRVFFYLEDRERTFDTPMDKLLLSVTTFADELEREKARQRVSDAMRRKAKAGHVCGGSCFGYRNVDVFTGGAEGQRKRAYVTREIVPEQAAVIRYIFELCVQGFGLKGIAKRLNQERVLSPEAQRGRPAGWSPASVREVLYRDAYRGEVVYNKTCKRDAWGRQAQHDRPAHEWIRVPLPERRIVSDAMWAGAHARLRERRASYLRVQRGEGGPSDGRGIRRQYLLSGMARCACCHGSMQVVSRRSGKDRQFRYICATYWNRGKVACANSRMVSMPEADAAVLALVEAEVLRPRILHGALDALVERLRAEQGADARATRGRAVAARLTALDAEIRNLVAVVAAGRQSPALLEALAAKEGERAQLRAERAALEADGGLLAFAPGRIRQIVREVVAEWSVRLHGDVAARRRLLDTVLSDRVSFQPVQTADGAPGYEVAVPVQFSRVFSGIVPDSGARSEAQDRVASPTGFEPVLPA